jgi:hypothetical protein
LTQAAIIFKQKNHETLIGTFQIQLGINDIVISDSCKVLCLVDSDKTAITAKNVERSIAGYNFQPSVGLGNVVGRTCCERLPDLAPTFLHGIWDVSRQAIPKNSLTRAAHHRLAVWLSHQ